MTKQRLPIALLLLFFCSFASAQQLSLFTQYRENMTLINPAAMESDFLSMGYNLSVGANYRKQWAGISGSPTTQSLRFSYINKDLSGATFHGGAYVLNDQTGPTGYTGFYGRVGGVIGGDPEFAGLSLGVSAGFVQYRVDASQLTLRDPNDILGTMDQGQGHPDVGFGLFYYQTIDGGGLDGDMFYVGASVPQVLGFDLAFQDDNGDFAIQRVRHYYGQAGFYKFFYDDSFLEPSLWVKYVEGAPVNVDLNLRYQLPGVLWLGVGGSSAKNFHFEAGVNIGQSSGLDNNIKIGYGFDYNFSSFGPSVGSTHEFQVAFAFDR